MLKKTVRKHSFKMVSEDAAYMMCAGISCCDGFVNSSKTTRVHVLLT